MPTSPADSSGSLGFLLNDISRLLRRNFNRRVQHLGLTHAQWRAIGQVVRSPGIGQAALSELLEVQPITLARLIDRLEAAGWIERRPHPTDRRAVRLFVTDRFQPLLAEISVHGAGTRSAALKGFSSAEQELLYQLLERVKDNLGDDAGQSAEGSADDDIRRRARP
jgi:DNA-binding MarR family transcriptional regulator